MAQPQAPSVANEPVGWIMVALASVITGMGFGALVSVTVFLEPLEADFGWVRTNTSFAYMGGNIMAGMGGIFAGWLSDRYTTAPVILMGALSLGASFVLLALMQTLNEFYLIYWFALGGFGISAFLVPLINSIAFWFNKNRGLAISITFAGQTAGAGIIPYFSTLLMKTYTWRETYLILAIASWMILIPLCFLWRDPPGLVELKAQVRAHTLSKRGQPRVINPNILVAVLSLAILGCCVNMTIPLVHLVPLLRTYRFDPQQSASALSVLVVASVFGRIFFGKVMDKIGGTRTLLITSGMQTVSLFWFTQTSDLTMLYALAVFFGVGYAGVLPCYPVIINGLVPAHLTGRSVGIVFFMGYLAMGLGGWIGGILFDLTGDYVATYAVGVVTGVFNLLVILWLHLYVNRRQVRMASLQPA